MAHLAISFLGAFEVLLDGEAAAGFHSDKARALLAYVAVEDDRPHRRERLAALLWPDQPESAARHSLRQALFNLRQVIGDQGASPRFLDVTRQTIQFNPSSNHRLDTATFRALLATCEAHHHRRLDACRPCLQRLEHMAELYRGDFLQGFTVPDSTIFEEWALSKQEWFHQRALFVLRQLANYHEQLGTYEQARTYALREIELEPWREEAHRQVMRLLAMTGRRSAALVQYETCQHILAEELGVEPAAATTALYEQIRDGEGVEGSGSQVGRSAAVNATFLPTFQPSPPVHSLPAALTPFVGRQEELTLLSQRLGNPDYRLLTVAGPGGVGKSRLALEAARQQIGLFRDGVYWVPLAAIESVERLVPAIAHALDVPVSTDQDPRARLIDYLRQKETLLVLDSFEHLMPGADLVLDVLRDAPQLYFLVTSRERLNLQAEAVLTVRGLPWPPDYGDPALAGYAAIRLFLDRAGRAQMDFRLSAGDMPQVVRICRLLEGMPLGIELAAAWVATRAVSDIADAIEKNLDFLTTTMRDVPVQHRSLRAVFEHSWDLLGSRERQVLRQLTVFRGGFTVDAARQVVGADGAVLTALADKSLLYRLDRQRYGMHNVLRQYAAEKSSQWPEEAAEGAARHAAYYAAFLEAREEQAQASQQEAVLAEIGEEMENVWAGWEWAVAHANASLIGQAAGSLYLFCETRGWFQQGVQAFAEAAAMLRRVLSRRTDLENASESQLIRGRVLNRQAGLQFRLGHHHQARHLLEDSLELLHPMERTGSTRARAEVALARKLLGNVAYRLGHYTEARHHYNAGLTLYRELGDRWEIARCLSNLGLVSRQLNEYAEVERYQRESLAIRRDIGDQRGVAVSLNSLGVGAYDQGQYATAGEFWQESLEISQTIAYQVGIELGLNNLGRVAYESGDYLTAEARCTESLAICREIGYLQGIVTSLHMLGRVACAAGRYEVAKSYYQEALSLATSAGMRPLVLRILIAIAELLMEADIFGDSLSSSPADRRETALELLVLVLADDAGEARARRRAEDLLAELKANVPALQVEAARYGGADIEVDRLVNRILHG